MKRLIACSLLTFAIPAAHSAELLCTGTGFAAVGSFENKVVVRFDPATTKLSLKTLNGWAEGTVRAEPDLYLGQISTESGLKYWINLHRYTGEFFLARVGVDGQVVGPAEFTGTCKSAERKF